MRPCPRCHRTNPAAAVFCYYDGVNLNAPQAAEAAKSDHHLPHPFVFPSGRSCKSYDDLVQACQEEWATASELLRAGAFGQFLTGVGRLDLAKVATDSRNHPDADLALDAFLARLPGTETKKPRLELEPRRLQLDPIRRGEKRTVKLTVINQGHGLLSGTINVSEGGDWLRLLGANDSNMLTVKTVGEQIVRLEVDARKLLAPQKYIGRLAVVTNGGIVEVVVRLTVLAHGFPKPPFQGAGSPRDMAVRMRGNPKAAVPLLESGEVSRWFAANQWGYPVQGDTAPGMAAVQQFFECMGLARAPHLDLDEIEARYTCQHPEELSAQVVVQSPDRKWVFAHADSNVHWLKVTSGTVSGPQKAVIRYVIDSSLLDPDRVHDGLIEVVGNGGQKLSLRVRADVRRGGRTVTKAKTAITASPVTMPAPARVEVARPAPVTARVEVARPAPVAGRVETARPEPKAKAPVHPMRALLIGALAGLLLRVLLALPADLYARVWTAPAGSGAGTFMSWNAAPTSADFIRHFTATTWWLGAILGAVYLGRRGSLLDVPFGLIAGAGAGAAGGVTFACLMPILDAPARLIWHGVSAPLAGSNSVVGATLIWIIVAVACWTGFGALVGLLRGVWRQMVPD